MNNTDQIMKNIIESVKFIIVVILMVFAINLMFKHVPFLEKYDNYIIRTGSMEPVIDIGDLVVVDNNVSNYTLSNGDVIAFRVDLNGDGTEEVVVHYFYEYREVDGQTLFTTISEVSNEIDPWLLETSSIIGVFKFKLAYIGKLALFAQSTIGRIVIIADIFFISILFEILKKKK